jgi:hypothetical protein
MAGGSGFALPHSPPSAPAAARNLPPSPGSEPALGSGSGPARTLGPRNRIAEHPLGLHRTPAPGALHLVWHCAARRRGSVAAVVQRARRDSLEVVLLLPVAALVEWRVAAAGAPACAEIRHMQAWGPRPVALLLRPMGRLTWLRCCRREPSASYIMRTGILPSSAGIFRRISSSGSSSSS